MKKILLIITIILVVAGSLGAAGFFFVKNRDYKKQVSELQGKVTNLDKTLTELKANPAAASQKASDEELKALIAEVGKFVELPTDETPSLATVQDKEKLKDQVFFSKAENGDKLLIYTKSKTAYLWRPTTKKLINFGPVSITQQQEQQGTQQKTNP